MAHATLLSNQKIESRNRGGGLELCTWISRALSRELRLAAQLKRRRWFDFRLETQRTLNADRASARGWAGLVVGGVTVCAGGFQALAGARAVAVKHAVIIFR